MSNTRSRGGIPKKMKFGEKVAKQIVFFQNIYIAKSSTKIDKIGEYFLFNHKSISKITLTQTTKGKVQCLSICQLYLQKNVQFHSLPLTILFNQSLFFWISHYHGQSLLSPIYKNSRILEAFDKLPYIFNFVINNNMVFCKKELGIHINKILAIW